MFCYDKHHKRGDMNNLPTLSVIVTIYNAEEYLHTCLESIIHQTYTMLDIILVNDGSTDNSLAICQEYGNKDDRIRIINKPNGGLVSARKGN